MSLKCPMCPSNVRLSHSLPWEFVNWFKLLAKHEKLAGVVRISAGTFLAPGQKICPSIVPQMSLSATVFPGNVIIGLHGKRNMSN